MFKPIITTSDFIPLAITSYITLSLLFQVKYLWLSSRLWMSRSKPLTLFSKAFHYLFDSREIYLEKFLENFLISYFKSSHLISLFLMFSSSKFFKETVTWFFISSMNFALCSKEQWNFHNPLPLDRMKLFIRETRIDHG